MASRLPPDSDEFFGTVDFKGERFSGANLPVILLENIKVYQELLLDLAEEIWREKNPERQRLPKNFRNNLSLSFSHVEDGSAVAVLKPDESISASLLPDEFSINYMSLAQSRFLDVVRAANENRDIEGVPEKARRPISGLLANLREGELLEFVSRTGKDSRNPRVRFSHKTRDRILECTVGDRQKRIEGLGIIRSMLDASEEVEILSEHGLFRFRVGRRAIRESQFPIASFCDFSILAVLRANGSIKSVVSQEKIESVELGGGHERIRRKIAEFSRFSKGWKNGEGSPISDASLAFAQDISGFICGFYDDISLFPQVDGTLTFEFEKNEWDVEVNCRDGHIRIEVYDGDMNLCNEQVFFGLSPKLLGILSDVEGFAS